MATANYHNKLNKNLCWCLALNCLVYFIFSERSLNLNIESVTNILETIQEIFDFEYGIKLFAGINFLLLFVTIAKTLISARKIPVVLLLILSFILVYDPNIASLILINNISSIGFFESFYNITLDLIHNSEFLYEAIIKHEYRIENIYYMLTIGLIAYSFIKKNIFYRILNSILNSNTNKPASSKSYNKSTGSYNSNYSTSSSYNDDDDDYYYNNRGNLFRETVFRITNSFDREEVYNKRFTNYNDKVIDEYGTEKYVWEYANDYEYERRAEEDRRWQEEQNYYNNYYNNDSYNYDPHADNSYNSDSYGYNPHGDNSYNSW